MAFISISIAVVVFVLSKSIISILYGVQYINSSTVLSIYVWAGVPVFLGVASSQYLIAENLTKVSFYRTLLGCIANVILNYILIPKYGIEGAAWATLILFRYFLY
jgi:O-antigen/teichoic acid export membrane protein